uniref:Uncharacterized protein n=1 Tax=Periophthalmus magnuspinnatus TaxID=409849 RepID=A0A3B3ZNE5_9GOBI
MCILRWYALLNDFGQCLQVKGSSLFLLFLQSFEDCATDLQISLSSTLCWTLRCCLRLDDCEKALSQRSHWYGRSPEWVRLCRSRQLDSANLLPFKWVDRVKVFVQRPQLKGLSLVCSTSLRRVDGSLKTLPHWSHGYAGCPSWENLVPHRSHLQNFGPGCECRCSLSSYKRSKVALQ